MRMLSSVVVLAGLALTPVTATSSGPRLRTQCARLRSDGIHGNQWHGRSSVCDGDHPKRCRRRKVGTRSARRPSRSCERRETGTHPPGRPCRSDHAPARANQTAHPGRRRGRRSDRTPGRHPLPVIASTAGKRPPMHRRAFALSTSENGKPALGDQDGLLQPLGGEGRLLEPPKAASKERRHCQSVAPKCAERDVERSPSQSAETRPSRSTVRRTSVFPRKARARQVPSGPGMIFPTNLYPSASIAPLAKPFSSAPTTGACGAGTPAEAVSTKDDATAGRSRTRIGTGACRVSPRTGFAEGSWAEEAVDGLRRPGCGLGGTVLHAQRQRRHHMGSCHSHSQDSGSECEGNTLVHRRSAPEDQAPITPIGPWRCESAG